MKMCCLNRESFCRVQKKQATVVLLEAVSGTGRRQLIFHRFNYFLFVFRGV